MSNAMIEIPQSNDEVESVLDTLNEQECLELLIALKEQDVLIDRLIEDLKK